MTMEELSSLSSVERNMHIASVVEAMAVDTIFAAAKSLLCFFILTGSLLSDITHSVSPKLTPRNGRFPFDDLCNVKHTYHVNKDASDSNGDEDEDDDDANDQDDEEGDEDFSGEGEEEADPEDDPEANGAGGSDGDDDDGGDDDDDDDDDGEDEDEEEGEDGEDEEEVPQPPTKKRK